MISPGSKIASPRSRTGQMLRPDFSIYHKCIYHQQAILFQFSCTHLYYIFPCTVLSFICVASVFYDVCNMTYSLAAIFRIILCDVRPLERLHLQSESFWQLSICIVLQPAIELSLLPVKFQFILLPTPTQTDTDVHISS